MSYIERRCLLKRNLAIILPLKSKFSEKIFWVSMLLMEVLKYWKIVEFPKILIKKFKTFYKEKQWATLRKLFSRTHQIKTSYVSGIKIFLQRFTGIYKHWGAFSTTLSHHHFCILNWVCKRSNAFSYVKGMKKPAGRLQSAVSPPEIQGRALVGDQEAKDWEAQCIWALRISYFNLISIIFC